MLSHTFEVWFSKHRPVVPLRRPFRAALFSCIGLKFPTPLHIPDMYMKSASKCSIPVHTRYVQPERAVYTLSTGRVYASVFRKVFKADMSC